MAWSDQFASKAKITASASIGTTQSVLIAPANQGRVGAILWNNSSNSVYVAFAATGDTGNNMTVIIAAFSSWVMPNNPAYTGPISGKRNAGSGSVVITELLR